MSVWYFPLHKRSEHLGCSALDVAPSAAGATWRIRSGLLKDLDFVVTIQQPQPALDKVVEGVLSPDREHSQRGYDLAFFKPSLNIRRSAQPPGSQGDLNALVLHLDLLTERSFSVPWVPIPTYRVRGAPWILARIQASFSSKSVIPRSRVHDRVPVGQEHLGGAGRRGFSGWGTTFVVAQVSEADKRSDLLLVEGPVCGGPGIRGFAGRCRYSVVPNDSDSAELHGRVLCRRRFFLVA